MRKFNIQDLLVFTAKPIKVIGNKQKIVETIADTLSLKTVNFLTFISPDHKDKQELVQKTRASMIICDPTIKIPKKLLKTKCFIVVKNPKLAFTRISNNLFLKKVEYSLHPTAFVDPQAKLHKKTYIGPFAYIGKSEIGEGSVIGGHCYIYDNVRIGKNVSIRPGTVIGSDGFGYVKNEKGSFERFPHIAGVLIGDNVEIGANTCINRGSLNDTIIKNGVKIDDLVHISHNVVIGLRTWVIANAMIGGSVIIGDDSFIGPSVTIRDYVKIGKKVFIGMGSVVTKDIGEGQTVVGAPARAINEFRKLQIKINKLLSES